MEVSTDKLSVELERALLRQLGASWFQITMTHFQGALERPRFRLVDGRSFYAHWQRAHRTISVSRPFVFESDWGQVVEVLKHEIVHQYVHEVLGAIDEPDHGPAFHSICERIGLDPRASGPVPSEEPTPPQARILKRVADLLALAESGNQHEAENAAALAQRLMLKHNIALSERPERLRYGHRQLGTPTGRVSESEHILAAILADHFFVEAIWVNGYRPRDGKRGSFLEISGTAENLELASYVHSFLKQTAERLWLEHKRSHGITKNRERRRFISGVMEGFRERLRSEKKKSEEKGLVWVGDADLADFYRRRHPHVRTVRLRGHGTSDARRHGREAGRNIVLRRGMRDSGRARGRALPRGSGS